jgi:hypothetical protein
MSGAPHHAFKTRGRKSVDLEEARRVTAGHEQLVGTEPNVAGRRADAAGTCHRNRRLGRVASMTSERDLVAAYLRRDAAIRYPRAPMIQDAIERYAQCIEAGDHLENPK